MTGEPEADRAVPDDSAADEPISDLTLAEVLAGAAEELPGVSVDIDGDLTTWSAAGRPFATLVGEWAEFHLAPAIARAALRTPDAAASPRGAGRPVDEVAPRAGRRVERASPPNRPAPRS